MTLDLKRSWQEETGRISRTWANKEQKSKKKRREGVREGGMEGMGRREGERQGGKISVQKLSSSLCKLYCIFIWDTLKYSKCL